MGNILTYLIIGIMAIMGGVSCLYILISLPATLIYKFVRMSKGCKFFD